MHEHDATRVPPATLGEVIRARRIELGLTQEQLAERIGAGVRQSEVSRLERDRITLPRRSRLEAIAAALDLGAGELLASSGWTGALAAIPPADRSLVAAPTASTPASDLPADLQRLRAAIERAHATRIRSERILSQLRDMRMQLQALHDRRQQRPAAV